VTVLDALVTAIQRAASHNAQDVAAPRVILWPDEERLWGECIDALRSRLPALWSLGEYAPAAGTGPAVWLRYQLGVHSEIGVIYLPGIGRAAFRSAEACPDAATHLYALQFRGQFWTQKNGKDWTPFAFFSAADGGLGLDVAGDSDTKRAIAESLPKLLHVDIARLSGRLEAADFRALVTVDPPRTLLRWMGNPTGEKARLERAGADWASFRAVCRDSYDFDPEKDGAITAAERLMLGAGAWPLVWRRYKEAPRSYPGVKELLESRPLAAPSEPATEVRPRTNQREEARLQADLLALENLPFKEALARVKVLAGEHGGRASWVWAELGDAPLAVAIGHLRDVAEVVESAPSPSTWTALAHYYANVGWTADRSMLRALNAARSGPATSAVSAAIRAVYAPWLEKFADLAQVLAPSYPSTGPLTCRTLPVLDGTVYLFADGMRMDIARGLEQRLVAAGLGVEFACEWSALPTVTATAKPAWMPLASMLGGPLDKKTFQSKEKSTGKALSHERFKQLVAQLGITFLDPSQPGLPTGCAWTEYGSVDTYGHQQGSKLAWRIEEELLGLQQRVQELLKAGWRQVRVVTDHGWLMLPGGLPKTDLPSHLALTRWSRCAIPDPSAQHGFTATAWFWDGTGQIVLAQGASCFIAGTEYAHGGLSMQEALVPSLTVVASPGSSGKTVLIGQSKWSGMRLQVALEGADGLTVAIRRSIADDTTTIARASVTDSKKASLLVTDDDALGKNAFLVVLDGTGQVLVKQPLVIGED